VEAVPRTKVTNPRVFHLVQNNDDEERGGRISNSAIPRHESPILKAIARVHEGIEFLPGEICIMPSKSSINALAKAAYSNNIEALKDNIRLCCQYKVTTGGRIIHLATDEREQLKHHLVEETLSLLPHIYPTQDDYPNVGDLPALRKNGMRAIIHPLQVGSGVAAIEAPLMEGDRLSFAVVVMGLLHDTPEDTADDSEAMKNVKFRARSKCREIEIVNRQEMMDYLVHMYSEYSESVAKSIASGLLLLTRGKIPQGMTKEDYYVHDYLRKLYKNVFCAKVKAEDFHSNSMAIRDICDETERLRLAKSLIPKGLPQVLAWKKNAWVEYHRLLARLEDLLSLFKNEKFHQGIVNEIMAPSAADLDNFENGFVLTGSRRFNYKLMATMPPSGSPVLTHYQTVRDGKLISEIEIPFCRNLNQAKDVIMRGFHEVLDENIMQAPNIIQKRLGSGAVYTFEAKEKWNVYTKMKACRKEYDRMLNKGAMGPAFSGFERAPFAQAAREKWGRQISEGSQRLEGFKFYKVQVR